MEYNTQLKKLALPEYGRNIQNMVDYCLTIPDRQERKRCANTIINIMGNLFPHLRDVNDFKHILWDHLAIMSDFKLDIDYPYEVIKKEDLGTKPGKIEYSRPDMTYRHYGKTLEKMAHLATTIEDPKEKEQFVLLVATHMKKSYIQWNKEVEDRKIFADLYELTNQKIDLRDSDIKLPEMKDLTQRNNNSGKNTGKKKK
ncbi:DUF4290 domain-containing protein [Dysgonomonas sp. Marseille-P4361]|uniref:DUF4290 domain-containing protein n=1 Tax=Dysgonomonas sp. Marseille-P4361 TaxID=2161820 RepID=UPI000D55EA47|nr:DUF4290 domain-containing protein [Dysgonomonas sp. Marseille-P4361]